jgi:hypothetical protein
MTERAESERDEWRHLPQGHKRTFTLQQTMSALPRMRTLAVQNGMSPASSQGLGGTN